MPFTLALVLLAASRLVVTEVMADPAGGSGSHGPEDRNEFIEVCNPTGRAVDVYGWTVDDGDSRDRVVAWSDSSILAAAPNVVIGTTWLRPGGYAVVLDSEYTDTCPVGGHVRPYRFGDSTLILTVSNTTLGNGLANSDPVTLASAYGDTSTFGTPRDSADGFPHDAGDGKSWERVRMTGPDTAANWQPSVDADGCTPGRPNSVAALVELAITGIFAADSAPSAPGRGVTCLIGLASSGAVAADGWSLTAWLDRNGSEACDPGEEVARFAGWPMAPGTDTVLSVRFPCPDASVDLWARLVCPQDHDTTDNRGRLTVAPGAADRMLSLGLSRFSPDRDGFEDSLPIFYRLPEPRGTLAVVIFDLAGRPVRTLRSGPPAADRGVVFWDGNGDDHRPAAPGIYAVRMEYRKGGSGKVEKLPVVLLRD